MQEGLFQFFSFLNKTVENAEPIDLDTNDELGIMVKEINKAIEKIKVDMLKDDRMITNASEVMSRMKTGYFDTFVEEEPSDNNLNKLKTEVNQLIEDMQNKIGKNLNVVLQVIESYSTLNFTVNIEDADSLLEERLNKLGLEISNMLNDNLNIGQQLEQKSDVLKESFDELSIASNKQAASLEETAASIEEITGNIRGNTDKAEKMTQLANQAKSTAEDGETLIIKNTKSMEEIDESTKRIDEAILQIEQIAFQTNILSLNAAVEAATAGEHGKGFAVVASEVRNLASKSADVAKEIKLLVVKATERTSEGRQISGQIKEAFGELIIKISETAELVGEVAEANKEQLTGMVQISETSSTLDITTQENVKIVTQTDIITKELFEMATKIVTEVKKKKFIEYSGE
jgi:methyl-accepting chemotaxis protein